MEEALRKQEEAGKTLQRFQASRRSQLEEQRAETMKVEFAAALKKICWRLRISAFSSRRRH